MNYQPSLPDHNVNVSHDHPIREFFILVSGVVVVLVLVFWLLGLLVDYAVEFIPPEQEAELFANLNFDWTSTPDSEPDTDSEQEASLQGLLDSLQTCLDLPYPITVTLVKSEQVNAVAIPGGNVLVFSGLLESVSSQNGLAFVLAHELGHFVNRDHLRGMGRGILLAALSTVIFGANSDISQMLASASGVQVAQYSQERESLADRTALHVLSCHYGHVGGAAELFVALQELEEALDFGLLHYFATHPELQTRIDDLQRLSKELGFTVGETKELLK